MNVENASDFANGRYLFKSITDGVFYIAVYLFLPLASIWEGLSNKNASFFFTAFSCCICIVYDCYSRYSGALRERVWRIYLVGAVHFLLAGYTYFVIQKYTKEGGIGTGWLIPFCFLSIAPILGGYDVFCMMREDYMRHESALG